MKIITVAGTPCAGKTSVIAHLVRRFKSEGARVAVAKFDALATGDDTFYRNELGIPAVRGLSDYVCPDHYYVANLEEVHDWGRRQQADLLFIETAGLCFRCAPHIEGVPAITVIDNLGGLDAPEKMGPALGLADVVVVTKSELLSDIEQFACGDTLSGRRILLDGKNPEQFGYENGIVAQLSQKTGFIMDGTVSDFIRLHARSRGRERAGIVLHVLAVTNSLCGEPVLPEHRLQVLSGGQSRALMIADIACISDAPVVLIDEIENAGIDKLKALAVLMAGGKLIIVSTHDPILTLMAGKRVVMKHGAMTTLYETSPEETRCLDTLRELDAVLARTRNRLRSGQLLTQGDLS